MKRFLIAGLLFGPLALGQETQLGADFRKEGEALKTSCTSLQSALGCAEVLFTDHPLHIAVGSLAPQNGVGFGPAFVAHWTPNETWRLSWDMDAVATSNGSWRAGAYMTAVLIPHRTIVPVTGGAAPAKKSNLVVTEYPVFHAYAESTSLNKLTYFGEGPNTSDIARSYFGMTETIVGANAVYPVLPKLNMSLLGEANGRFVNLRPAQGLSSPSIEQVYSPVTAPGLSTQPAFAQFGEGIRIRPQFAAGYVRLNYLVNFQEYVAGGSKFSFERLTVDLTHEFPLYRKTRSFVPRDSNGPDDCSSGATVHTCPSVTRDREGSFALRFVMNESFVPSGNVVPFYFQPTLGGSDISGNPALSSYQDYRFRAPNNILARASFEHSIYGPFGVTAMIDEGKVALTRGDIDFTHLRHSYAAGLTLRAGGFPMVYLLFSWGGREGMHTLANINTSLLGGSAHPSLY
jgi:hypothetical protein